MFSNLHSSGKVWGLAALLAVFFLPQIARSEQYIIRNDTSKSVVVQATCVFQGRVQRDRPHTLKPKAATPALTMLGSKVITVYDALVPTRVLYRGNFPPSPINMKLLIIQNPAGAITIKRAP